MPLRGSGSPHRPPKTFMFTSSSAPPGCQHLESIRCPSMHTGVQGDWPHLAWTLGWGA